MVHDRNNELICGDIFPEAGVQPLEMMIFALDLINNNFSHLLPGIKLGGIFVDDCDRDTVGVERSLEFVQGIFQGKQGSDMCHVNEEGAKLIQGQKSQGGKGQPLDSSTQVVGVVGAASSVVSIQVASLLRLFKIPQVRFHVHVIISRPYMEEESFIQYSGSLNKICQLNENQKLRNDNSIHDKLKLRSDFFSQREFSGVLDRSCYDIV